MSKFGEILVRQLPGQDVRLDAGYLAELLLFYKRVNLVIDKLMLNSLFELCDLDTLYILISSGRLNIHILENYMGGMSTEDKKYTVETFNIQNENTRNIVYRAIYSQIRNSLRAIELCDKYLEYIKPYKIEVESMNQIRAEFTNESFVKKCLEEIIGHSINDYKLDPDISIQFIENEPVDERVLYDLNTNFDFTDFNDSCLKLGVKLSVNPASLLLDITSSLCNLQFAEDFQSNVLSTEINSKLIGCKFDDIKANNPDILSEIRLFQQTVVPKYIKIGDIIRSKERSFAELLNIIEKADKFKDWLEEIDEDESIIEEYYKKISEKNWLQKAPWKNARHVFFLAAGTITDMMTGVPITSMALSSFDNFLLDKITKGWRPNQFIDEDLKTFLE